MATAGVSGVLLGSQARGVSDRLSDIDLLVVVTGSPLEWRERETPSGRPSHEGELRCGEWGL